MNSKFFLADIIWSSHLVHSCVRTNSAGTKKTIEKITWVKFAAFWLVSQERHWTNNRCSKEKNSRGFLRYTIELQFIFLYFYQESHQWGTQRPWFGAHQRVRFQYFRGKRLKEGQLLKNLQLSLYFNIIQYKQHKKIFSNKININFCSRWVDFYFNMGSKTSVDLGDGALFNQ